MTRFRILPYKNGSRSAKALAEALGGKRLKLEGSRYKYREGDVVINWGNSTSALVGIPEGKNLFGIDLVSNKWKFFNANKGAEWLPTFWTNKEDITDEDFPVVCRTILSGHSGAGIVLADCWDDLVDAPLYVKYIKKKEEYRVHVGWRDRSIGNASDASVDTGDFLDTVVIAVQRKARRLETPDEEVNWQIRNHSNGFVYVRNEVNAPECVTAVAQEALKASGLDFGAVDVIYNEQQQKAYVLEINTAPGLEGQTVDDYVAFFTGKI